MGDSYSVDDLHASVLSFIANIGIDDNKTQTIAADISSHVTEKRVKLVEVVICLKEYITSSDDSDRLKALNCLSSVLGLLPRDALMKSEVSVVVDFFLNKFDDSASMREILHGLSNVAVMKFFFLQQATQVLKTLKEQYESTQYPAATRYFALLILERFFDKFEDAFSDQIPFNNLFIETFLLVATGEKDPRNLLISFTLNSKITTSMESIDQFKEDLFDILFCYFPITFKPPKNDPYKITNSDLKMALRSAISATSYFAEDAFGNLIDKMTASSPTVKNDTILTLRSCITNFDGEACLQNWLPIWNALKFEIMHTQDFEDTLDAASGKEFNNYTASLDTINSIACRLFDYERSAFDKFHQHVFEELKPNFKYEKDLRQSCAILSAVSRVNAIVFDVVMSDVLKLLLTNSSDLDVGKQKLLILNLSFFFDAYIAVFSEVSKENDGKVPTNKLLDSKDEILMILGKALNGSSKAEVSLRTLAVVQLTKLVKMPQFLEDNEVSLIVQYLTETILTDENKNVYFACLEGLKTICDNYENIVSEVSLQHMLNVLPENVTTVVSLDQGNEIPVDRVLKVILDLTITRWNLVITSVKGLSTRLSEVSRIAESGEYCFLLISCLYSLLDFNHHSMGEEVIELKRTVEPGLFKSLMNNDSIYRDDYNLALLSTVLFFINIRTPVTTHQEELNKYLTLFVENSQVLDTPKRSIITFTKLLSSLDKKCQLSENFTIMSKVVDLLKRKTSSVSEFEKVGYLELLALLSNKWGEDAESIKLLDREDDSPINLEIIAWVTKGLIMKNSPLADAYVNHLLSLLQDNKIGPSVARLLEVLVIDIPTFSKIKGIPWNNNVRLLYKQKFFNQVSSDLVSSFKESNDMAIKSNYLTALSLVLKNTPSNLTISYISELLPLLIQAIQLNNSDVKISALNSIKDTLDQSPQLITDHVHSLIPILLNGIKATKDNTVMARLLCLQILQNFSLHVPLNYLLPFKDDIISGLTIGLDDKKRAVRKQCVDTRQKYFELGQVPFE
ncbi:LAFE_0E12178g1_1 [Lachancea fermentati]|uniref:MMS19 nucleotide excision repair protein n=1 Tax=Lachancea fermentati TaxID=4955 RepID=A0A1G4ME18_LACFM|nr:LAFE_0E12178g1_1 [Lachancea fermentati]